MYIQLPHTLLYLLCLYTGGGCQRLWFCELGVILNGTGMALFWNTTPEFAWNE
jgi:hypothetical protein